MQTRRLGRLGHESSVLLYGAAALAEVDQDTADASVQQALDGGINHLDVAADYGDAELRLGPWLPQIRDRVFLASKTGLREAELAWRQIQASLERLQTDHLDLLQLHAVCDLADLDRLTAPGGALEAAVRARDEGLVRGIGITGHGHDAPAVHLVALGRFPFDTVLTPWNRALSRNAAYAADFAALGAEIARQDAGLMTIKAGSMRNWPGGADQRYATWYEPFDDEERVRAAVGWVLSHPQITGIATAGDVRLLPLFLAAERAYAAAAAGRPAAGLGPGAEGPDAVDVREAAAQLLDREPLYRSPFDAMPAGV